jgi:uncharacterized protein YbjT (DUF2867 family)
MTILVIGASGNVGSGLMRILAQRGVEAVAAHHSRPAPGEAARRFDFDDPETWPEALDGVDKLFLIPKSGDPYPDRTVIPLMRQAQARGVKRIVFLTAMALDKDWRVLKCAEDHLIGSGLSWTILRPNWMMQNFTGWMKRAVMDGVVSLPVGGTRVSHVDTRDCAEMAFVALTEDRMERRELTLTGPQSLTWEEVAATLSEAASRPVRFHDVADATFRNSLLSAGIQPYRVEQMLQMMAAVRKGLHEEVDPAIPELLGRPARSLAQFCAEHAAVYQSRES